MFFLCWENKNNDTDHLQNISEVYNTQYISSHMKNNWRYLMKTLKLRLQEKREDLIDCLSIGPASEIPKLIHYRVVVLHTPDSGLTDL